MNPHGVATATSRQRVYQFHHLDNRSVYILEGRAWQEKNEERANFFLMKAFYAEKRALYPP